MERGFYIYDKCISEILAAGGFRIVCGLHVQRCTYLYGGDMKLGVRLLKTALDLNNMDRANAVSTSQTRYSVAYPGIFFGRGGGIQEIQLRTENRGNGDLGA